MFRDVLIFLSAYVSLFAVTYYLLSFLSAKEKKVVEIAFKDLPSVTIAIPAHNESDTIIETIRSALELEYPKNKLEIIVIDNASKDDTYKKAISLKDSRLRVFKETKVGKGNALNLALKKARGEIFVSMDADTFATKESLKRMVRYFADPGVMCVTPSMTVRNTKKILEKIQQIEYFLGVYLRKAFSTMNAIHVTPGAFSVYRKSFFDKTGGYEADNMTEDMEVALRIQYKNYKIECSDDAVVYTKVPNKFKDLLIQRRRWYYGWIQNILKYRRIFSRDYGELGTIVLPVAIITIFLAIILTSYLVFTALSDVVREITLLNTVNFDFSNKFKFSEYVAERYLFSLFSDPKFLILIVFIGITSMYMVFAKMRVKQHSNIKFSLPIFLILYSFLLSFWWLLSIVYALFVRKISWR
jgi:cellulose synthase/poly-beta-1,6-N-acetylglucosamine synthase-like glycosyltransferase